MMQATLYLVVLMSEVGPMKTGRSRVQGGGDIALHLVATIVESGHLQN